MSVLDESVSTNSNALRERFSGLSLPWKSITLYVTISLGFFLLGLIPMSLKASRAVKQRDAAQREVRVRQLQSTLGNVIVNVQRGEYELARQSLSEFYSNLRGLLDSRNDIFTSIQQEKLRSLLEEQDEIMTLLARTDVNAAARLSAIYASYLKLTTNG